MAIVAGPRGRAFRDRPRQRAVWDASGVREDPRDEWPSPARARTPAPTVPHAGQDHRPDDRSHKHSSSRHRRPSSLRTERGDTTALRETARRQAAEAPQTAGRARSPLDRASIRNPMHQKTCLGMCTPSRCTFSVPDSATSMLRSGRTRSSAAAAILCDLKTRSLAKAEAGKAERGRSKRSCARRTAELPRSHATGLRSCCWSTRRRSARPSSDRDELTPKRGIASLPRGLARSRLHMHLHAISARHRSHASGGHAH